jgi:Na+/H+ antiporter NhaD/arsenite permease-like protein
MFDITQHDLAIVVSVVIFVGSYSMFVTEKVHRTVAALFGASMMIIAGLLLDFYSIEEGVGSIDFNTIGLLLGMMIIIGVMSTTGFFSYLAVKAAKIAKGDHWRIMWIFCLTTAFLSAFLDNVTTILFMVPITISITKTLEIEPTPLILAEILSSNVGGASTLIGDPPNIIIGTYADLSFTDFVVHLGLIIVVTLFISLFFLKVFYRDTLAVKSRHVKTIMKMDERKEIKDPVAMKKGLTVLGLVIVFFIIQEWMDIPVAAIALVGAGVLLFITKFKIEEIVLEHIEWPTLLFFGGLFVMVGGLEKAGVLDTLAEGTVQLTGGNLYAAVIFIIWISAFASAFIDNIPFTATMVFVIDGMNESAMFAPQLESYAISPLWWALALGACLGGNGTLVGASANLVAAGMADKAGYSISFKEFMKVGLPFMILTTFIAMCLLLVYIFFHI